MGKTITVKGLGGLRRALVKDLRDKERRVARAAHRAAMRHKSYLYTHIPVAFGELRSEIKVVGGKVVVDAPHAAAVERGSRPHWMPLEPLIEWVKLRGFQGLASSKQQARMPGTTTSAHATRVAGSLAAQRRGGEGFAGPETSYSDMGAPVQVAKAIQLRIALAGTKPTWFMRDSIPVARGFLAEEIRKELDRD